jgi:hypothetical protein
MKTLPIPESISEYLELDESSDSGLVWIKYPGGGTAVGKQAGHLHQKKQRWAVKFKSKLYYCYRIVYYLRTGIDPGERFIDHATHETDTNNNLRIATQAENMANSNIRSDNTSGFKGVTFDKVRRKWKSRIHIDSREIFLGRFKTQEEAAHAYNAAALEYRGEFACLNVV